MRVVRTKNHVDKWKTIPTGTLEGTGELRRTQKLIESKSTNLTLTKI